MPINLSPGLAAVKQAKQDELRESCKRAIITGFEYDGAHYPCTIEDQINLMHDDHGGALHGAMRDHIAAQRAHLRKLLRNVDAAKTDADVLKIRFQNTTPKRA